MIASLKYAYKIFGLSVASEFALPFAPVDNVQSPDVTIRRGSVPDSLGQATDAPSLWQTAPSQFLLSAAGAGRFLAADGTTVTAQVEHDDPYTVSTYLGGPVLAALLQQRGLITLRAAGIKTPAGAVLFAGSPGVGKTALLAKLQTRGFAAITDGIAAIQTAGGDRPLVLPARSPLLLRQNCIAQLPSLGPVGPAVHPGVKKHSFATENWYSKPLPVAAIYALNEHNLDITEARRTDPRQAIYLLRRVTYGPKVFPGMGMSKSFFDGTMKVAGNANLNWLHRPITPINLDMLADFVEDAVASLPQTDGTLACLT